MKLFIRIVIAFCTAIAPQFLLPLTATAQLRQYLGQEAHARCAGSNQLAYGTFSKAPTLIHYGPQARIPATIGKQTLANALHLRPGDDALRPGERQTDDLGYVHQRYQQLYKGIAVEGGQYALHEKDGLLQSATGLWIDGIDLEFSPSISESKALEAALARVKARHYKWEFPQEEALLKEVTGNALATYYPKAELVIVARDFDYAKRDLHLCYKFEVYASEPLLRKMVYVDASTAEIVAMENRMHTVDRPATAATKYSGNQPIMTDSVGPGNYRLREASRGLGIETYDLNTGTNLGTAIDFTNATTFWNTTTNYDNAAYDAHWGLEGAYDYYLNVHNHNSIDGAGKKLRAYVHYDVSYSDAQNMGNGMFAFGDGNNIANGWKAFTSIDIVAHEMTHGLTENTARLNYGSESGALNESFSDILGTCVEFYKKPATADFKIAEQIAVTNGQFIRNMANPNAKNHPDTYGGTFWYTGGGDNGGVHTNSGVQNFWFYLLCMGGSGTNDIGSNYNVTGITMAKAEKIAFRTLTVYMHTFSRYAEARQYSILAAQDLYGACSAEVIATTNAWYAVGVGAAYVAGVDAQFAASGVSGCALPFDVTFVNTSVNATNATWDFGDGGTSNALAPTHTYLSPGTFTVKLVASSICGTDSMIASSYITVSTPTAPTVSGDSICGPNALTLTANGSGTLEWYVASTGGSSINTGASLTTPVLNNTTTYYVEDRIAGNTGFVGPTTWAGQFGTLNPHFAVFNVMQACTLKTVKTQSYYAGLRNIELKDQLGNVLQNFSVNLPIGNVTIPLNFPLLPGMNYNIGGDTLGFAFDNFSTAYPYTLPGVASITGNTVSSSLYLFFYDWEFETAPCVSVRTPVTATIFQIPTVTYNAANEDSLCLADGAIALSGGSPAGGTYSGTGVGSGVFTPAVAGVGSFPVTYDYVDVHGCTGNAQQTIQVFANPTVTYDASTYDTLCAGTAAFALTGGSPAGGVYAGTGVNNGIFDGSSLAVGDYTITYSFTDGNGCGNEATQTIHIDVCAGLPSASTFRVAVYPNPNNGRFTIDAGESTAAELEILNAVGLRVLSKSLQSQKSEVELQVPAGVYCYRLTATDGKVATGKIIVK